MRLLALLLLLVGTPALAHCEVHPDRRFVSFTCYTWGNGPYQSVTATIEAKFSWMTSLSNYPTGMETYGTCLYLNDPPLVPKPGAEVVTCSACAARTVIPVGETMPRTFWPKLTIGYTNDFNEGWSYNQCWCAYDKAYYGGSPVPTTTLMPMSTTTTTMMPTMTTLP